MTCAFLESFVTTPVVLWRTESCKANKLHLKPLRRSSVESWGLWIQWSATKFLNVGGRPPVSTLVGSDQKETKGAKKIPSLAVPCNSGARKILWDATLAGHRIPWAAPVQLLRPRINLGPIASLRKCAAWCVPCCKLLHQESIQNSTFQLTQLPSNQYLIKFANYFLFMNNLFVTAFS